MTGRRRRAVAGPFSRQSSELSGVLCDGMNLTRRNHYNPCFWAALWNESHYLRVISNAAAGSSARAQRVHALNIRSGAIYRTAVENVHFDKSLGLAEMTPDSMKSFCRRRFPGEYAQFAKYIDEHPDTLTMDFENILAGTERHGHTYLLDAARNGGFSSVEHKGFVTCLVIIQAMRSHEFMATMVGRAAAAGIDKWEYFWLLKGMWADRSALARAVAPLACARWTLYRTARHVFPLCDSPVMINRDNVMVTLSPRLLAEIDLTVHEAEDRWTVRDGISTSKYREFRRRAIQNTYKDILFSDEPEATHWSALPEFRRRMRLLSTAQSAEAARQVGAQRVLWAMSGFGRVPHDFERRIEPIMNEARAPQLLVDSST